MTTLPLQYQSDARGLLGFRLGTPLRDQRQALDAARAVGFTGEVDVTPGAAGQFILQGPAAPGGGQSIDSGVFLECDTSGVLTKLAVALAMPLRERTSREAAHAAEQLVDLLNQEMGAPSIVMDNLEGWSHEALVTSRPDVAYSAVWQPVQDPTGGPGVLPIQPDVEAFVSAVRNGCTGPVALVSITAGQGSVVALLELKTLPAASTHDVLASFFNRARQRREASNT